MESVDPRLVETLAKIYQGIRLLGDGLILLLQMLLSMFGLQVPDVAVRIGAIILLVLSIWKIGNVVGKIWICALAFLLISMFAGLIPSIAQCISGVLSAVATARYVFLL